MEKKYLYPDKCKTCQCFMCDRAEICDIGDCAPLNPCDTCGDTPYLSLTEELCNMRIEPPTTCEETDCETCECLFDCMARNCKQYLDKKNAKTEEQEPGKKRRRSRSRKRKKESAGTASA